MARLTDKQQAFIDEYFLCGLNATEAARRAGYKGTYDSIRAIGSQNLTKPQIRQEIDRRLEQATMNANEVLFRLAEQAHADIGVFFKVVEEWTFYPLPTNDILDAEEVTDTSDPENPVKRVSYLIRRVAIDTDKLTDPRYSHLLHKVADTRRGGLQIELYNKQNALVHLGKYYALFTDKVKHEDWRTDAIEYIRKGEIDYRALADEFGTDLATELFAAAGVSVEVGTSESEE